MMNLRRRISELGKLADSDDWWDREIAGFALRDLIEDHFAEGMKLTRRWSKHRSARIRRAACQSLMQRKAKTTDERLRPILKRLDAFMKDDDIYVRKCCGPYVVAYLAYTYPRIVMPWLKDQARSTDLNVRANVAKAFSQSLGTRRPADGVAILKVLAKDQRRRVRQAVLASARNISKGGELGNSLVARKLRRLLSDLHLRA
jgi:3-methyladenine DNA glycosylase AlkC